MASDLELLGAVVLGLVTGYGVTGFFTETNVVSRLRHGLAGVTAGFLFTVVQLFA